jgi:hypothetical protein
MNHSPAHESREIKQRGAALTLVEDRDDHSLGRSLNRRDINRVLFATCAAGAQRRLQRIAPSIEANSPEEMRQSDR